MCDFDLGIWYWPPQCEAPLDDLRESPFPAHAYSSDLALAIDSLQAMSTGQQNVPRRVLVVEDNPVNQRVAVRLLTKRGHWVTVARNGLEALAALEKDPFDIVLMDVQMPEMDGLETTARIRERERVTGEHLYIIATTAHAMKGDRERYLASGMDAYVPKPIDQQVLFDIVESERSSREPTAVGFPEATTLDVDEMCHRLGDDEELIADVIHLFLEDYPGRLEAIESALVERDPHRIRNVAHTLKGSASTLSASAVMAAAGMLEEASGAGTLADVDALFATLVAESERLAKVLRELQARRSWCRL